jgi:HK97 family phage major capsid protein
MAVTNEDLERVHKLTARLREIVDIGEERLGKMQEFAEDIPHLKALNERLDQMEAKYNRPSLFGESNGDIIDLEEARERQEKAVQRKQRRKAFNVWARKGLERTPKNLRENLVPTESGVKGWNYESLDLKALNLTDDTLGGYFVLPDIIQDELIRNVVLISPIRGLARVTQTSSNSVKIPVLTAQTAAAWVSETGTRSASTNPQFGMKDIPTHECYAMVLFSRQLLEDSFFDLEAEMSLEYSQQFAKLEGTAFVTGTGVGQPLGFLNDPSITGSTNVFTTASSGVLAADDLIGAVHNFKAFAYYMQNAQWVFNLKTLGVIRKLKDSQNRYLWEPGLSLADPPMILNMPYTVAPDMPDVATSAYAVAFGDFKRGYRIVDRTQIAVQRLEELYATSAQIGMLAYKRVGAQTVLAEAIYAIQIHS